MGTYRKLTDTTWTSIRRRYEAGESPRRLAEEFGVAESTLFRRRVAENWGRQTGTALPVTHPAQETTPEPNPASPTGPRLDQVSTAQLEAARSLRTEIMQLVGNATRDARPGRRPQTVRDLTLALERLQRIERTALGADQAQPQAAPGVVILLPGKLTEDEWRRRVEADGATRGV